jgi:hypothetical protein
MMKRNTYQNRSREALEFDENEMTVHGSSSRLWVIEAKAGSLE